MTLKTTLLHSLVDKDVNFDILARRTLNDCIENYTRVKRLRIREQTHLFHKIACVFLLGLVRAAVILTDEELLNISIKLVPDFKA